jgi:hypothetical protein
MPFRLGEEALALFGGLFDSEHLSLERINGFLLLGVDLGDGALRLVAGAIRVHLGEAHHLLALLQLGRGEHDALNIVQVCVDLLE